MMKTMAFHWSDVRQSLARPYSVTIPMVLLVALVPLYIFIPALMSVPERHAPEIALDRLVPLQPFWAVVYGALYGFLILLPVFVVRTDERIRRTVRAYLFIWITAYVFFALYPTVAPRPPKVIGEGFFIWGLQTLYSSDPPYNCFPSLHVAHSFVSALAVRRVHRGVGIAAIAIAVLVALSTLFTKQHYVLDVLAGISLASLAVAIFFRTDRESVPDLDRRAAPSLAILVAGIAASGIVFYWIVYRIVLVA